MCPAQVTYSVNFLSAHSMPDTVKFLGYISKQKQISAFVELLTFWKEMDNNAQVNYTFYML